MLNLILYRKQCCFRVKSHSSPVIRSSISVLRARIHTEKEHERDSNKRTHGGHPQLTVAPLDGSQIHAPTGGDVE